MVSESPGPSYSLTSVPASSSQTRIVPVLQICCFPLTLAVCPTSASLSNPAAVFIQAPVQRSAFLRAFLEGPVQTGYSALCLPITFVSCLIYYSLHVLSWQDSRLLILCTFFCLCILFWFGFRSCFIAQGMYEIQTGGFLIVFSGTPIKNVHIIWLYFFQWTYPDFEKANKYF